MAVTVANSSTLDQSYAPSHDISGFSSSGTNPYVVLLSYEKNPASNVTTVTADSNAMTLIAERVVANVSAVQAYGIIPTDSSQDLSVATPSYKENALIALNLNGVDQTTPYNATTQYAEVYDSTISASITGTSGNVILVVGSTQADSAATPINCTQIESFIPTTGLGTVFAGIVTATGSSQTLGFSVGTAGVMVLRLVEVNAASAPPSLLSKMGLMDVG